MVKKKTLFFMPVKAPDMAMEHPTSTSNLPPNCLLCFHSKKFLLPKASLSDPFIPS